MTNTADFLALAEQIAASHAGSWELDCKFLETFGWHCPRIGYQVDPDGAVRSEPHEFIFPTRDLGHALLFAKPPGHSGWTYHIEGRMEPEVEGKPAESWHKATLIVPPWSAFDAFAYTAPLALCAAIYRMLAHPRILPHFVPHGSAPHHRG